MEKYNHAQKPSPVGRGLGEGVESRHVNTGIKHLHPALSLRERVLSGAIVALLCFSPSAHAEDYTYAPEGCDFRMTFPEEPLSETRCNAEKPEQCYKTAIFNRVFALDSSVRVTVTCNKAEENMLERYSGEVMQFTLEAMAKEAVSDYQTSFADHGEAKEAIILGSRQLPDGGAKIYMAQLWIGKTSVLTVEGEVSGVATEESDTLFMGIMKSVRPATWDGKLPETSDKAAEKPVENKGKNAEDSAAEQEKE